ncbi:MAG: 5-formyltetrahydrofolate cyclo-ligase [Rickettsiales bacterium]|jgi:5-formyltetrahydrofolate cyclo-ligase|nr:5-formyltetrahydrofolate cyclo-ligase [Rickettsiales bacterium]
MFSQDKKQIRKTIISLRNNLPELERQRLQLSIAKQFKELILPIIGEKKLVAVYYPTKYELDILTVFKKTSIKLLLPVINQSSKVLNFYSWKLSDKITLSKYAKDIKEPYFQLDPIIPDVVIAPLIACDLQCNRVGSGKAMYDYTIEKLRRQNPKIIYMTVCYDFQLLDSVPTEPHDQKLDIILTESRIIRR